MCSSDLIKLAARIITPAQLGKLKKLWKPFTGKTMIDPDTYRNADDAFHALLFDFSGNNTLKKAYNLTFVHTRIVQMGLMRPPAETLPEHLEMIDALEKKDPERAARVMSSHITNSKAHISNML